MQQALFETAAPTRPTTPPVRAAGATPDRRPSAPSPTGSPAIPTSAPVQRWWRLQGEARRRGRVVEPLLVTPRFLARIDAAVCPVTRQPMGLGSAQVVGLRPDAALAAGHLVTLSTAAAAALLSRSGQGAGEDDGLDAAASDRLSVLRSFVQPLTPAQAATMPLLVLPPNRVRVLSPVQGLQVAATLALRGADRAVRLLKLATLPTHEDQRQALRVLVLTLLARCPTALDTLAPRAAREALEDLWRDPLLQRRWERLALRLRDPDAESVLQRAHATRLLGPGWRPLEAGFAVDGWDLPAARRGESPHVRTSSRGPGPASRPAAEPTALALSRHPERRVASAVLASGDRRHGLDAAATSACSS